MTKRVPTGVSLLGVVLALTWVLLTPNATYAESISHEVALGGPVTIGGEFGDLSDVALFHFILDEGATYEFSAITNSLNIGGFDPNLALYRGTALYRFGEGDIAAVEDDDETLGLDAMLTLVLEAGDYTLALAHTGNEALEPLAFSWDEIEDVARDLYMGATCETDPIFCGSGAFSVTLGITPVGGTPVPEPGTLSLLALGSLATAFVRRRRRAAVTTRP